MNDSRTFFQLGHADGFYNNVQTVQNNYYGDGVKGTTRMNAYFQQLLEEIEKGITADVFDDLDFYRTKLAGTKDVEEKLADGGFRPTRIKEAQRLKEMYAKLALQYDCYPSAQKIFHSLFARIKNEFYTSIFPLIEEQQPLNTVMEQIRNKIVVPIRDMLENNGEYDKYMGLNEDHIYGMIYYMTGMCHLNWKDYDNV